MDWCSSSHQIFIRVKLNFLTICVFLLILCVSVLMCVIAIWEVYSEIAWDLYIQTCGIHVMVAWYVDLSIATLLLTYWTRFVESRILLLGNVVCIVQFDWRFFFLLYKIRKVLVRSDTLWVSVKRCLKSIVLSSLNRASLFLFFL